MKSDLQENVMPRQSFADLDRWMERYQQADPDAPAVLVWRPQPCFASILQEPSGEPGAGAVKQKAHRAYARLRKLLQIQAGERAKGAAQ